MTNISRQTRLSMTIDRNDTQTYYYRIILSITSLDMQQIRLSPAVWIFRRKILPNGTSTSRKWSRQRCRTRHFDYDWRHFVNDNEERRIWLRCNIFSITVGFSYCGLCIRKWYIYYECREVCKYDKVRIVETTTTGGWYLVGTIKRYMRGTKTRLNQLYWYMIDYKHNKIKWSHRSIDQLLG